MIKQFTDAEYAELADKALKWADPPVAPPMNLRESPALTCKAVHRHLCGGAKASDLTPYERQFAAAFANMKLTTVEEVNGCPTGNRLPAVEVE